MIPVVTPEEMRAVDRAAPEPVELLVERAGAATATVALEILGRAYGKRVVVVAGKGNNGADGRAAARRLARKGARVRVLATAGCPAVLPTADLVVDAAYGTGFRGSYEAPEPGGAPVLAVDVPSGVDGLTGVACEGAVWADATVTFAALKPGLLLSERSGEIHVADIGLDVGSARAQLVEPDDVHAELPRRARSAHKYDSAVLVVAGSVGMTGAASLAAAGALRAGAGYVRLGAPGLGSGAVGPVEAVSVALPPEGWAVEALAACERMRAAAVGPGLGRDAATRDGVRRLVAEAPVPLVVDGDGLVALGRDAAAVLGARRSPVVLTPHDGEFAQLTGVPPGDDRLGAARTLAAATGATVLLKGPVTVVAAPDGEARFAAEGGPRLATAGTGDVLTGVVAAFLAIGLAPLEAASLAAMVHGRASKRGRRVGLVASDLPALVADVLSER